MSKGKGCLWGVLACGGVAVILVTGLVVMNWNTLKEGMGDVQQRVAQFQLLQTQLAEAFPNETIQMGMGLKNGTSYVSLTVINPAHGIDGFEQRARGYAEAMLPHLEPLGDIEVVHVQVKMEQSMGIVTASQSGSWTFPVAELRAAETLL